MAAVLATTKDENVGDNNFSGTASAPLVTHLLTSHTRLCPYFFFYSFRILNLIYLRNLWIMKNKETICLLELTREAFDIYVISNPI